VSNRLSWLSSGFGSGLDLRLLLRRLSFLLRGLSLLLGRGYCFDCGRGNWFCRGMSSWLFNFFRFFLFLILVRLQLVLSERKFSLLIRLEEASDVEGAIAFHE